MEEPTRKIAKVVVLGDIGRSPRMQYHAISLANNGFNVKMIGYMDTMPVSEILENRNITLTKLNPIVFSKGPKILQYAVKVIWQVISLLLTLLVTGKCDYLLCQNPPAIPTLPVCRFYCLISRTNFIIDWHNYAYSIMALTMGDKHTLVKISKFIEKFFGQSSDHNFCVTYAMKKDLLQSWNIEATVLYDRPPKMFHPVTIKEKHDFFVKISQQYPEFGSTGREQLNDSKSTVSKTAFTELVEQNVVLRANRPGLLLSSTSWTPDEDFSILMQSLQLYETTYSLLKTLPKLICVITGKGPMKQHYIEQIASRKWQHVCVITPWLEACDYPTMVASADLGVCLHTSSSGLDLPMKIVDMFGAGLPVCAYAFGCLNELVKNGKNGYTFQNTQELSEQLVEWFKHFPQNQEQNEKVEKMKSELIKFQECRWEENWNLRVKKFFDL